MVILTVIIIATFKVYKRLFLEDRYNNWQYNKLYKLYFDSLYTYILDVNKVYIKYSFQNFI